MPNAISFKAIASEWSLVLQALEAYKVRLDSEVESIEDEDQQNEIYDELERLDSLIPDFQSQFNSNFK
ncbi:hypothetical protein A9Q89_10225 [Gammaproteobacteria bacterium 53_120_T64]|nr:hypothetical protein A9Q89_10225 [Gammaproteobacteria bacterium 53_120_T64]